MKVTRARSGSVLALVLVLALIASCVHRKAVQVRVAYLVSRADGAKLVMTRNDSALQRQFCGDQVCTIAVVRFKETQAQVR